MLAMQLGQHRVLTALHGRGMVSEQGRAPAEITSSPKRTLIFPPPPSEEA